MISLSQRGWTRVPFILLAIAVTGVCAEAWSQNRDAAGRLRELDKNGDQALSREEAGATLWTRLERLDANGDGKVTLAEFQRLRRSSDRDAQRRSANVIREPQGFDEKLVYQKIGEAELHSYIYRAKSPSSNTRVPAIVFFHGGAWRAGGPQQFEKQCQHFARRGMTAMTVEYRLTTQYPIKIDACVEDAKSAMRWVRSNADKLRIDPSRIAASGGSAGGHLAACTAVVDTHNASTDDVRISARPNALVLFNPALILAPDERLSEAANSRLKAVAGRTRGRPALISPLAHARQKQPPCVMFFGTEDRLLLPAKVFQEDSRAVGNQCELITYEGQGHSFFNKDPYLEKTIAEADRFLVKLGWLPERE